MNFEKGVCFCCVYLNFFEFFSFLGKTFRERLCGLMAKRDFKFGFPLTLPQEVFFSLSSKKFKKKFKRSLLLNTPPNDDE